MSGTIQILEQAFRSNDESLIDYILNNTLQPDISGLIAQLQPGSIIPFIRSMTQHVQRFPASLSTAIPWMESLVNLRKNDIAASAEGQRRIAEFQNILKQRTQQMGLFIEVHALSNFVHQEKEGSGIGLPIVDTDIQDFTED
jgi:hypothetical protein